MPNIIVGKVLHLFVSIKGKKERDSLESLSLDKDGVVGDKFYAKNPLRAILLTSLSSYNLAINNDIELEYGLLGENIIIDYDPYDLKPGDTLQVGEVELEIAQNCTLCNGLSKVHPKLPKLLKDGRGVFVKAITNGRVKKGDNVFLLRN